MFPLSGEPVAEARRKRWKLQTVAARLLPEARVANCYRKLAHGSSAVSVMYNSTEHKAYYSGLMTCGSVWTCPVCSAKITEHRREELSKAVAGWRGSGGSLVMVTITLQHERDDELQSLLHALKDSWRRLKSGRKWLKMRSNYGLAHYVGSTEVTHGDAGWHPHIHALFFSTLPEAAFDKIRFQTELTGRYVELLEKHGRYAHSCYGIDVRTGDDVAGNYVSKYGLEHELTKSVSKNGRSGRSPFQLLEAYSNGDRQAGALFQAYASVFHGARQLSWSHGARAALGLVEEEKTDEELAAQEPEEESQVLAVLSGDDFRRVALADLRCEVLEVASRGDAVQLWLFLELSVGLEMPRELT